MSVSLLSTDRTIATAPTRASTAATIRDAIETTVFYGLIAVGLGTPIVLSLIALAMR